MARAVDIRLFGEGVVDNIGNPTGHPVDISSKSQKLKLKNDKDNDKDKYI